MKLWKRAKDKVKRVMPAGRTVALLLGVVALLATAGCNTVTRYSVDSYEGFLPLEDQRYLGYLID
jgi:hypothetical protein